MPERDWGGHDPFRAWIDANMAALGGRAGPVWTRAEALYRAWAGFVEGMADAQASVHGAPGASPFDPAGWLRGPGAGGMADLMRWLEGPVLADLGGEARAQVRATREWVAYLTAVEQMKAVLGEAWLAAFRRFAARLGAGEAAPGWDRVLALWEEAAEAETARVYRSSAFLAAQRDLMAAETALRRTVRARAERVAEALGLPTRAEMDDLGRSLHAMRRELRRMRDTGRPGPVGGGRSGA